MFRMNERVFDVSFKHSSYYSPSVRTRQCLPHVLGTGHYLCNRNYIIDREGYNCYMIMLTTKGRGLLSYKGKEYELLPGCIFFINCSDRHRYRTDGELWEIKWLHLNGGGCSGYYSYVEQTFGPLLHLNDTSVTESYLDTLLDLLEHKDFQFDINASLLISQILTTLIHPFYNPDASGENATKDYLEAAISYIEKNYSAPISLDKLASLSGYSKYYFLRLFKNYTGSTPYEYLILYKINLSKKLLRHTRDSIDAIACQAGFNSTSNYIKLFKKQEAMTPNQYRNMLKGE